MSNDLVYLGKGNLAGRGVYAKRNILKDEIVIRYNLHELTTKEWNDMNASEQQFTHIHHGKIFLYSEPERYVNHSTNPNTIQDLENGCDIALRNIKKDEMITTNSDQDDI